MSLYPAFRNLSAPRCLFVDMNAFYTSVEQQECSSYRGKPVIVVPVLVDHTCTIAASYEAKRLGVKAGTSVRLARIACPGIHIVEARPELYLDYHNRLVKVLNEFFAWIKVLSVDEMVCRIPPRIYSDRRKEKDLARRVEERIRQELGEEMRCSIGIAANVFLAKVASETQKPDGLTTWDEEDLPEALFALKLADLPGIGPAMRRRLAAWDIATVRALWETSPTDLRRAWGSVLGERWYYMLRGSQEADYQPMQASTVRKSVGHSNVLAPQFRSTEGATCILLELFAKALKRLRAYKMAASSIQVTVQYRKVRSEESHGKAVEGVWSRRSCKHLHANDERTWLQVVRPYLAAMPDLAPTSQPTLVSITFGGLLPTRDVTLSLFDEEEKERTLSSVVDQINRKHAGSVKLAGLKGVGAYLPLRIPYGPPGDAG